MSTVAKFLLALLTLPIGCAHQEPYAPKMETLACLRPLIKTLQEPWSKEDEKMLRIFNEGCVKHFTKNHCSVRVLKSKNLSYQVTCKKVK